MGLACILITRFITLWRTPLAQSRLWWECFLWILALELELWPVNRLTSTTTTLGRLFLLFSSTLIIFRRYWKSLIGVTHLYIRLRLSHTKEFLQASWTCSNMLGGACDTVIFPIENSLGLRLSFLEFFLLYDFFQRAQCNRVELAPRYLFDCFWVKLGAQKVPVRILMKYRAEFVRFWVV